MAHIATLGAAMFTDLALCTTPVDTSVTIRSLLKLGCSGAYGTAPNSFSGNGLNNFDGAFSSPNLAGADTAIPAVNLVGGVDSTVAVSQGYFANYVRIASVKEFPAIGTPANIVKVPAYGQKTSSQVNGQSDLNNMELTLNYVAANWKSNQVHATTGASLTTSAGYSRIPAVGDGNVYLFRFALLASDPDAADATDAKYNNGGYPTDHAQGGTADAGLAKVGNSIYYFLGKLEALEVTPSLTDALTAKLTISIQSAISGAWTQGL